MPPQTLADLLGVPPLNASEGSSLEAKLETIKDGEEFGLAVINSIEFRRYIVLGLQLGTLPGFTSILGRLMDHALGKPTEHVEVKNTTVAPEELTAEQLEERASRLAEMARYIRRAKSFDEPEATDSVH